MGNLEIVKECGEWTIEQYTNGRSCVDIGKELGVNHYYPYIYLKERGYIPDKKMKRPKDCLEDVQKLYEQRMYSKQICRKLGISHSLLKKVEKMLGITIELNHKNRDEFFKEHGESILTRYKNGESSCSISKDFPDMPESNIIGYIRRRMKMRPTRIYYANFDFFEKIDTKYKAWILGWFYADGNVNKDFKYIRIEVTDEEIPEKMKEFIEYTGPIYFKKPESEKHKPQHGILITNKKIAQDISKLGCHPNKTFTLKWPTAEQVPLEFMPYFIRGYLEGDGNIYLPPNRNGGRIQIVGTEDFLGGLQNFLEPMEIKGYMGCRWPERKNSTRNFVIHKTSCVKRFLDYVYADPEPVLGRKYKQYQEFLERIKYSPAKCIY